MVTKCKIIFDTPKVVEKLVNEWIKDVKPSPLKREAKESGVQLLHTHVLAFPGGKGKEDKLCVVFFYEKLELKHQHKEKTDD